MAGKPRKYKTKEELEAKIDEYFNQCEPEYAKDEECEIIVTKQGPIIKNLNAPSLTGLALYLGYASRQSIYDNENIEEYSYTIKRSKMKVEEWLYQHSVDGTMPPAVGIFLLKNFGWTDKQEIEHSGGVTVNVDGKGFGRL